MNEFKKGDKVTIIGNESWMIGGIYNHELKPFKTDDGNTYMLSHTWDSELKGVIKEVLRNNHYIIESNRCLYLFTNGYNEMKKDS